MGEVLGSVVKYDIVCHRITLLWKMQGELKIIAIGRDIFLFRFELQSNLGSYLEDSFLVTTLC